MDTVTTSPELPDSQVHKLVQSKPPLEMKLEVDENGTVPREPVVKEEPSEVKAVLKSCDNFDLQIKAEYRVVREVVEAAPSAEEAGGGGERGGGGEGGGGGNKKNRGRNKNRPQPTKISMEARICPSLLDVGEDEPPGECYRAATGQGPCSFRHDVAQYMKERKPDLLDGGCYVYRTLGRCPRGVGCCFGSEHLTAEGRNRKHPSPSDPHGSTYSNQLTRDQQNVLRKKKFDFNRALQTIERVAKRPDDVDVAQAAEDAVAEPPAAKKALLDKDVGSVGDLDSHPLRPEEVKKIDWKGKLYLAPLTTVGNLPFRRLCKKLGADITCGEMAMSDSLLAGQQTEWALARRHSSEDLFGVQICGNNPYTLGKCAQLLEEFTDVDFIDLNLGCPIDLVYHKGAGSGLMQRTRPLEASIRSVAALLRLPFTVKMRTGVSASRPLARQLIAKCRDWGVAMVTLHGRSREQRYTKSADWDYIGQCVQTARPMPLFGNGDVLSYEDYEASIEKSQVDGIMIARGALIKPWLFTEIKERRHWDISASERFDYMKDFVNFGLEHWGSDLQGVERTRRFLLEWQSFAHRYVPVGLLERPPQKINLRPPAYRGRDDLETLLGSPNAADWVRLSRLLLGPTPDDFQFLPKHKANSWK